MKPGRVWEARKVLNCQVERRLEERRKARSSGSLAQLGSCSRRVSARHDRSAACRGSGRIPRRHPRQGSQGRQLQQFKPSRRQFFGIPALVYA